MKSIVISVNIGKDAQTRTTQGRDKVTSWTVAVEERQGQDKRTIWFDCNLWGARGEKLAEYLTKGGKVSVSGDLSTREHEGRTYLTVRADQVTLMGGKPQGDSEERKGFDQRERELKQQNQRSALDDEIPF